MFLNLVDLKKINFIVLWIKNMFGILGEEN